ncbi:MAG: serine/threonine-protein kinase [Nannocystales bacterium]
MNRETVADPPQGKASPAVSVAPGGTIGRFSVLGHLGEGGMGQVFEAYDRELDRRVAVKVLHEERTASQTASTRLLREAQALAKLSHPGVVAVYDVGRHQGQVYVAMEFVKGETLADWLVQRPRSWSDVVRVFAEVARGLEAMHALGIVHRDIKPENILIDANQRPRLIDFGLAKGLHEDEESLANPAALVDLKLTRTGALAGTPRYMSPEQFRRVALTPASDQFSLCVALFEGLYGQSPFSGTTLTARATSVLSGEVQEPDQSAVPNEILAVVHRGLRLEPQTRWASIGELAEVLEDLQASHDPELDDPDEARRRRLAIAAVGVVLVTIPGAFGFAFSVGWVAHTPLHHALVDVSATSAFVVVSRLTRSYWSNSRLGRALTAYGLGLATTFAAHSVTGWLANRAPQDTALVNLVTFATLSFFASRFIHPILRLPGVIAGVGTLLALWMPEHAMSLHSLSAGFAALSLALVVPRRRTLRWVSQAASSTGSTSRGGERSRPGVHGGA